MKLKAVLTELSVSTVKGYIEAMSKIMFDDSFFTTQRPQHEKEQMYLRAIRCKDCYEQGHCKICSCPVPGKWYVTKSCNPYKFGDLVDEKTWNKIKEKEGITTEQIIEQFNAVYNRRNNEGSSDRPGSTDDSGV